MSDDPYTLSTQHSNFVFTSLNATQQQRDLYPHETKHKIKLELEAKRFRSIDMSEHWPEPPDRCTIERRHRLSRQTFLKDFVKKQKPVIITGLMEDWPALDSWDFEKLGKEL